MTSKFDSERYTSSESITIKVPLAIPYAADSEAYERVDGEFEHNGEYYRLVKQRLYHDTLYVVCVKDIQTKQIDDAIDNYTKTLTDKSENSRSSSKTFINAYKDYISHSFNIGQSSTGWQREINQETFLIRQITDFHSSIIHPPERI